MFHSILKPPFPCAWHFSTLG